MSSIEHKLDLLRQNHISRREFITHALACGMALPAATALATQAARADAPAAGRPGPSRPRTGIDDRFGGSSHLQ